MIDSMTMVTWFLCHRRRESTQIKETTQPAGISHAIGFVEIYHSGRRYSNLTPLRMHTPARLQRHYTFLL